MEIPIPEYEIGETFLDIQCGCKREIEGAEIKVIKDRMPEIEYLTRVIYPYRDAYYHRIDENKIMDPERYKKL